MSERVKSFIFVEMSFVKAEPAAILATQARIAQQVVALQGAGVL